MFLKAQVAILSTLLVCSPNVSFAQSSQVEQFYRQLAQGGDLQRTPGDSVRYAERTQELSDTDIEQLMPSLLQIIRSSDHQLRSDGLLALFTIGQRQNGADLLREHVREIGELLSVDDPTIPSATATFISSIRPSPPVEVVEPLSTFLEKDNANTQTQIGAIYTLVRVAPDDPRVLTGVKKFFGKNLSKTDKESALNALGSKTVAGSSLSSFVYEALKDEDPQVRYTAVQVVSRMGPTAITAARPLLERIVSSPKEADDVKNAARQILTSQPNGHN